MKSEKMTLDEAITKYKEITNTDVNCPMHCMCSCDKCVQESGHIVEWLEELKAYIEIGTVEEYRNSVLDIQKVYNKAIDDFVEELKDYFVIPHDVRVVEIKAKQLKVGDEE